MNPQPETLAPLGSSARPRFTRRALLASIGLAAAGAVVASCAPAAPAPTAAPAKPDAKTEPAPAAQVKPSAGTVTIKYWFLGGKLWDDFYTKDIYPLFYKENPNIKVENTIIDSWGNLYNKLVTAAAGGAPPEVARQKDFFTPDWAMRGIVQELDDYVKSSPHITGDKYIDKAWKNSFWNGKLVAMPLHIFIHYLHYNPELFQKAKVESPPKSWDEFKDVAKKITDPAAGIWGTMLRGYGGDEDTVNFYHLWLVMAGGKFVDENNAKFLFNSPEGLDALKFQVDLIKEKVLLPPGVPTTNVIENGKVGMWFHAANYWPGYLNNNPNFKWCVARNPLRKAQGAIIRGNHQVLFKAAKEKDAGWKFLSFHATPDIDYLYAQVANYITARQENHGKPLYKQPYKGQACLTWDTEFATLNDPSNHPQPIFPGYQEATFKIGTNLMEAYMLKKTPEEALANAQKEGDDVLKLIRGYLGMPAPAKK